MDIKPTAQQFFEELFHNQDQQLPNPVRYQFAVNEFEAKTDLRSPYTSYESFRIVLRRNVKKLQ